MTRTWRRRQAACPLEADGPSDTRGPRLSDAFDLALSPRIRLDLVGDAPAFVFLGVGLFNPKGRPPTWKRPFAWRGSSSLQASSSSPARPWQQPFASPVSCSLQALSPERPWQQPFASPVSCSLRASSPARPWQQPFASPVSCSLRASSPARPWQQPFASPVSCSLQASSLARPWPSFVWSLAL
jgi:hypothetical protein